MKHCSLCFIRHCYCIFWSMFWTYWSCQSSLGRSMPWKLQIVHTATMVYRCSRDHFLGWLMQFIRCTAMSWIMSSCSITTDRILKLLPTHKYLGWIWSGILAPNCPDSNQVINNVLLKECLSESKIGDGNCFLSVYISSTDNGIVTNI